MKWTMKWEGLEESNSGPLWNTVLYFVVATEEITESLSQWQVSRRELNLGPPRQETGTYTGDTLNQCTKQATHSHFSISEAVFSHLAS